MTTIALGMMCKTPAAGRSKTRLSPPLSLEDCAALSACFIGDLAATLAGLAEGRGVTAYAIYTPEGSEAALKSLLPPSLALLPQRGDDLTARLCRAATTLFAAGHRGVMFLNADSPTLPPALIGEAVAAMGPGDRVVLGPAIDGGYVLIGLARPHLRLFQDMPWSTPKVFRRTVERAEEMGLEVVELPAWYDVDDAASLAILEAELAGRRPAFAASHLMGGEAPATRAFLAGRQAGG